MQVARTWPEGRVKRKAQRLRRQLLTWLLGPLVVLASWTYIEKQARGYYIPMMILQTGVLGVFCAFDLFLFYVFFEVTLIPMYFVIGIWGGEERVYAAVKFVLYTLAGSLLMLVGILWLGYAAGAYRRRR